eukprot:14306618-Alexandrium_andersonii.AAC.1
MQALPASSVADSQYEVGLDPACDGAASGQPPRTDEDSGPAGMEVDGGATAAVSAPSPVADSAYTRRSATVRCAAPESDLVGDEDAS